MKRSLQTAIIFAAFGLMLSGVTVCSAQMVGNYREAAKDDRQIIGAANFAVEARNKTQKGASLKFVAVERAEKQVVAGTNYRLCLTVRAGGANRQATAVVYQNLQNKYKLTSWTNGNCAASDTTRTLAPDTVVKNLYAAQAADSGPFFQTKDRAAVDRYFAKDFADLIWNDVFGADGVGNLDFDPLYNAQDTKITLFKIGKPEYGEGNSELADVPVTFKNMGKSETILFRLEQNTAKTWKISDIFYPSNSEATASLKGLLAR